MSLRKCVRCGISAVTIDDLELFTIHPQAKHGRSNLCKKCKYKYAYNRLLGLKKRINDLKNKPCLDCGNSYPPECMDFDHVRGKKLFRVSRGIWRTGWSTTMKEIKKCDLICSNCHRTRTIKRA